MSLPLPLSDKVHSNLGIASVRTEYNMDFFCRYSSRCESLPPIVRGHVERFCFLAVIGDFAAAQRLWQDHIVILPRTFLRQIIYIDCLARQSRYGDISEAVDTLTAEELELCSARERALLKIVKAYACIFTHGALRFALNVARESRMVLTHGLIDPDGDVEIAVSRSSGCPKSTILMRI